MYTVIKKSMYIFFLEMEKKAICKIEKKEQRFIITIYTVLYEAVQMYKKYNNIVSNPFLLH